jgi:hypothetical protein
VSVNGKENLQNSSDFEALDYLESERSEREFFVDLETLLREYLQKPSLYHAHIDVEGNLTDANGLNILDMCDRANEKHFGTVRYERVKAETDGLKVLQELYKTATENDVVLLASPPGKKKEGFGDMSVTNVSLVRDQEGKRIVETYTVPSLFLSIEEHTAILQRVANNKEVETYHINHNPRPDIVLASHPIKIPGGVQDGALNRVAIELGYTDFSDLKKVVENALKVEDDPEAEGRRAGLMSYIAKQIVSFRAKKDQDGLVALGRTVRAVFALEAAGDFFEVKPLQMIDQFKSYMHGFMYKQRLDSISDPKLNMATYSNDPNLAQLWELQRRIQMNDKAKATLTASMCGGGGWQDLFTSRFGENMKNFTRSSVLQEILNKSESSEEHYSFDHDGQCVVCKMDPKKLGPCEICEDCDRHIRAQVE